MLLLWCPVILAVLRIAIGLLSSIILLIPVSLLSIVILLIAIGLLFRCLLLLIPVSLLSIVHVLIFVHNLLLNFALFFLSVSNNIGKSCKLL